MMADLQRLERALFNADAAGDTDAATALASEIRRVRAQPAEQGFVDQAIDYAKKDIAAMPQRAGDLVAGAVRGAGSIGSTLLAPYDMAKDAMAGKGLSLESNRQRRADITGALEGLGANPDSAQFQVGQLGAEVAGTAGVGGLLGKAAAATTKVPSALVNALSTSGMRAGDAPGAANMLARVLGGGVTGGASAGLIDPEYAGTGAVVGAALPPSIAAGGKAGAAISNAVRGGGMSPEVRALAQRAKELGIDIPADRLVNSRPLNAVSSGLNYVPFSGRAATEARMEKQLTQAAARLIGQDTDNMALALRKASSELGSKFDDVLKSNTVQFDKALMDDVTRVFNTAQKELGDEGLRAISNQIDELVQKGADGAIDGQAAYNIKRTLDRIGRRNSPEAFHAIELKKVLMEALDRSIGPEKAAAFAKTRQQYGNMIALEKIAKNGVEGDISVAKLANLPNINNEPLQEIADIAAQFVKPREAAHGAMQRGGVALGVGSLSGLPGLAATGTLGRGTNMALNSAPMRNFVMNDTKINALAEALRNSGIEQLGYRTTPALSSR
jgi:hypothetical protein